LVSAWQGTKQVILQDLFQLVQQEAHTFTWEPFRPGVEIYRLYGDGETGPAAALLKYAPGAKVPHHVHSGYEHIMVLSGSQQDDKGQYQPGTLVINSPGSHHSVTSEDGWGYQLKPGQPLRIGVSVFVL
jgi:anti-sigma factor ChrR (cupin superfamily)